MSEPSDRPGWQAVLSQPGGIDTWMLIIIIMIIMHHCQLIIINISIVLSHPGGIDTWIVIMIMIIIIVIGQNKSSEQEWYKDYIGQEKAADTKIWKYKNMKI